LRSLLEGPLRNFLNFVSISNILVTSTRGTALVRGAGLGGTPGASTVNVTFTTATHRPNTLIGNGEGAGSTSMSIRPDMIGDISPTGLGTGFVTYGSNGLRVLVRLASGRN